MTAHTVPLDSGRSTPEPDLAQERRSRGEQALVYLFVVGPTLTLAATVWFVGISWLNVALSVVMYVVTCLGVTAGFHRYFTHSSFKTKRALKIALAITGSGAMQGPIFNWVADHRRHHAYSDKEGDPHSPWLYGTAPSALIKGFWHAHMGWLFSRDMTNPKRFIPDLLKDPDLARINKLFWLWTGLGLALPTLVGGLVTMSWWGAFTALFWAGLVRVAVLHHVTWSINSICHMLGSQPFASRDQSRNVWPLAILSMGESWHNLHHADPTCARHGVKRGQVDVTARLIWVFEKLGWAHSVRWPTERRLQKLANTSG